MYLSIFKLPSFGSLVCDVFLCFLSLSHTYVVWYLIVSIPDLYLLPYFQSIKDHCSAGLYSKRVPIVPVLVESWPGQVNSGPW